VAFMLACMSDWADLAMVCRVRASVFRRQAEAADTAEERAACQRLADVWNRKAEDVARGAPARSLS
jgi:hypothetical protein